MLSNPEWTADLEYVWRTRTAQACRSLHARARRRRRQAREAPADTPRLRIVAQRAAEWAEHRACALAMSRVDVVSACDQRWRAIACGCNRFEVRVGCDQPQLCLKCRKRHSTKWRRRIVAGMDHGLREERADWYRTPCYRRRGMKPGIYLITLTAPHSGDLATDRDAMGKAVRKLLKHATKYAWWSTYALTWEATGGTRGDGHLHCHLAVISSWVPYSTPRIARCDVPHEALRVWLAPGEVAPWNIGKRDYRRERGLREVWGDAMPGAVIVDVKAPRIGSDDAMSAGQYLAKYVTKGVDVQEFTGRKAGELLVAFRSRRKVSTSADFWRPTETECERCGKCYQSVESPCSMQDLQPGAVLRSMAERLRWWIPRGEPQVALRWESVIG